MKAIYAYVPAALVAAADNNEDLIFNDYYYITPERIAENPDKTIGQLFSGCPMEVCTLCAFKDQDRYWNLHAAMMNFFAFGMIAAWLRADDERKVGYVIYGFDSPYLWLVRGQRTEGVEEIFYDVFFLRDWRDGEVEVTNAEVLLSEIIDNLND